MRFLIVTGFAAPFLAVALAVVVWAQSPPSAPPAESPPPTSGPSRAGAMKPPEGVPTTAPATSAPAPGAAPQKPGAPLSPEEARKLESLKNLSGNTPTQPESPTASKPATPSPGATPPGVAPPSAAPPTTPPTAATRPASVPPGNAAATRPATSAPAVPPMKPILNPAPPPASKPATSAPVIPAAAATPPPAASHDSAAESAGELRAKLLIGMLYAFLLSTCIGIGAIRRVSRLLHTPLMSLTNAISAIAVVGAIMVAGGEHYSTTIRILGAIALFASTTNIISGFLITDRMLKMFKSQGGKA